MQRAKPRQAHADESQAHDPANHVYGQPSDAGPMHIRLAPDLLVGFHRLDRDLRRAGEPEDRQQFVEIPDHIIDAVTRGDGHSARIVPAGHDPCVHAALHVAGQRIADDHDLAAVDRSDRSENLLKKRRARLFRAERFRKKDTVHPLADAGAVQLFCLRGNRAV